MKTVCASRHPEGEPERVRVLSHDMVRVTDMAASSVPARKTTIGRRWRRRCGTSQPFTREVLETLRPVPGYLMYYPRWYPVRPGDWAYGIIHKGHEHTRWVELDGSTVAA